MGGGRERERWEAQERKNRRDHRQERNLTRILDTVLGEKEKKGTSQIGNLGNWRTVCLTELSELGYRASAKKAQLCQTEVIYLGYTLWDSKQWLKEARKQTETQIPTITTPRQLREFLDTAGFCGFWIPGFVTLTALLYPPNQGRGDVCVDSRSKPLKKLKRPHWTGVTRGVLTQTLGPWKRPVAYLSKKLDPVASGWFSCLKAIAAIALLVKDADKLTLGQQITVVAPHTLESIIQQPPDRWMTYTRMTHYQSILLTKRVIFASPVVLNPATLLPETDDSSPTHHCTDILAEETNTWNDLNDQPWPGCPSWYSSFIVEGKQKVRAAVVEGKQVIWASSLPEGT